jgi:YD repeat-containing protein
MSNKSNSSSGVISAPKGGGAMQGIGEKFSPDLHTGTGNFTVPISLPPGRNGFQPQLSLDYSTGNGNGPFGLGWDLSVPGVSRKTSSGVPRYDDSLDTFILSGAEDLVPVPGGPVGTTRFRPCAEGLFARLTRYHDGANDYWEVKTKDGVISVYGKAGARGDDPAAVADPANRSRVFAWKLSRSTDPFGNRIDYVYERDAIQTDGPHHWDQLYLSQIRYADYGDPANPRFLVTVKFFYENRPDPFSEYRAGFEIRTVRRCTRIEILTEPDAEILTRSYSFTYLDQLDIAGSKPPHNGVSLLSRIKVAGHDGNLEEELPLLEFGYTRFEAEGRDFFAVQGPDLPAQSLADPDFELVDLFGRGFPDILEMNGAVRYWRNLGGGRFDRPREMATAPAGLRLADKGVQMIDADGDGRTDLLVANDKLAGYFPLQFGGLWDRRSFRRYRLAPSFDLEDPEVRLTDLNGDGVTDAIRSGARMECFFNDPKKGWGEVRQVERRSVDEFPNVNFSDPRVRLVDLTGDGLQDIALIHDGAVQYWPNLGYGNWGKRLHMRNSPRLPFGYDPKRVLIGDIDGDGLADFVYVENNKVTVWINQSGNGWCDPVEIRGTPPVSDMDTVRLTDLLGVGVSGVLWSADASGLARANKFFLDFTGEVKPYLLNEMNNHMGAVTHVAYAPSTRFYLEDEKRPETRWKTPLPFPTQTVARVEVIDEISRGKLTTEYRYHHGYWDGVEREFRGFGRVDQLDTVTFEDYNTPGLHGDRTLFTPVDDRLRFSPPTLIKTWFHQGPIDDGTGDWEETDFNNEFFSGDPPALARPQSMVETFKALPRQARRDALRALRGVSLRTELYVLDGGERQGRPYIVTESLYGVREESQRGPGEEGRLRIFFPHFLAQRTTQWERGDDPMTQFAFTDDYDPYGQPRSQVGIAVPRGRDFRSANAPGSPYLATRATTDYVNRDDAQRYIAGRVARITSYEILNDGSPSVDELHAAILDGSVSRRLIGQTLNFYDGPAFQGLPFGQIGDHGVLARADSLVLTEEILRDAYKSGGAEQTPAETPPYLAPDGPPAWTAEYPQEFRDVLPSLAGYAFQAGGADSAYACGYFVATERRRYDCQDSPGGEGRGLLLATRDPLGRETTINYDDYGLLPAEVTDPAGLTTAASYDYRVFQAREVVDPNGNRTAFTFTPLGLLASAAVMGKVGENTGDTPEAPGSQLIYDFMAFAERGQPVSVRTVRRAHHVNDADVSLPDRDEIIETIEYSDGFGRLLQTRTQAEDVAFGDPIFGAAGLPSNQSQPVGNAVGQQLTTDDAPRVIVSGWQTYDNKGRVVEKYEPFFSNGFDYHPPTDAQFGQKAVMFYDPRGQVIRTVNPDGSEQLVIFGAPNDLTNPEQFIPTPWESYTYDANDNAGRTHPASSTSYQHHWNTPASIVVDALGRKVMSVARNGPNPETDWFVTRSAYDIQGNMLTVTDALGRVAFRHVYDLAKRPLRVESIDAGVRRAILDAAGNPVEERDSKDTLRLHAYDVLNRPIRLWARDGAGQSQTLRERVVYGDAADSGMNRTQAAAGNLLGKLHRHYDEAGLLTIDAYDFKGNVLEKTRRVISDEAILAVFNQSPPNWQVPAFRVDWQPPNGMALENYAGGLLDVTQYRTSAAYDALGRVKRMRYPQDVDGERKELRPHYNRAGALERVELDGETFVERIAYNAKGQRTLIAYGAGVMTRYAYDPQTFRLARLRAERYAKPDTLTYAPAGEPLQDFAYE